MSRVSIVIPVFNRLDLTLRCLESLRAAPAEVLVVDDGSTDGTPEALRRDWPQVQLLQTGGPLGFSEAANRGLAHASGDLLWLLNNDTEAPPDALTRLETVFRQRPDLGAAGAELCFPDGSPQWSAGRFPTLLWLFGLASGIPSALRRFRGRRHQGGQPVDWVSGAAMAIRREAWQQVGPLDMGFRFYAQDLDFCWRLRSAGWQVDLVPGLRVLHHGGATIRSRSGSVGSANPALLWADLLRWFARSHPAPQARQAARLLVAGGRLRLAARALRRPFLSSSKKQAWDRESQAFRQAIEAILTSTFSSPSHPET